MRKKCKHLEESNFLGIKFSNTTVSLPIFSGLKVATKSGFLMPQSYCYFYPKAALQGYMLYPHFFPHLKTIFVISFSHPLVSLLINYLLYWFIFIRLNTCSNISHPLKGTTKISSLCHMSFTYFLNVPLYSKYPLKCCFNLLSHYLTSDSPCKLIYYKNISYIQGDNIYYISLNLRWLCF